MRGYSESQGAMGLGVPAPVANHQVGARTTSRRGLGGALERSERCKTAHPSLEHPRAI